MSDQEVIDRLLQGTYKGEKITNVDYDSRTSSICDIWLAGGKRVSFTTGVKALEWVTIEEVIELAKSHLTQRAADYSQAGAKSARSRDRKSKVSRPAKSR